MSAVSFGSGAAGSGTYTFQVGHPASFCFNNTGADAYIDQIDFLRVDGASADPLGTTQLAIYEALLDDHYPGNLLALTDIKTGITGGTNTHTIAGDPLCVPDGYGVWVALRCTRNNYFLNAVACLNCSDVATPRVINVGGNIGSISTSFSLFYALTGFDPAILPVTLLGNSVGPGDPTEVRVPVVFAEGIMEGYSEARVNRVFATGIMEGYSEVLIDRVFVQSLFPVGPEEFMSDVPFPGFGNGYPDPTVPAGANPINTSTPGLAWSVHKKPGFKTRISESAAGNEVRNALMRYPRWDYELTYEFLEDRTGAVSSLKTLMGFFLSRQGSYDSWLFKDPDDYQAEDVWQGIGDGGTLEFPLSRSMGTFFERIGQVDTSNLVRIAKDGVTVDPGDYSILMPNRLVFYVAPAIGEIITATFQFYFVCRFIEDTQDYEKFMDKLWSLQTCEFRSIVA